ncbi:MAG: T9SS type A sorting domain-containing protein [Chitinophagales bacterium]|nr:T9SS type A sorting domain-containing protein [Chitinophagales bacterium]
MYASLSDISRYTTDAIGIYFSDTAITDIPYSTNIDLPAQINNISGNVLDTTNWTKIVGVYTANGGEQYMVIGNFKDDASSNISEVNPFGGENAYAYIEDVILAQFGAINDQRDNIIVSLYPDPFTDQFTVTIDNNMPAEITLYDMHGKKIVKQSFISSATVYTSQLSQGMYFYEVRNEDGIIQTGKVLKQ